MDEKHIANDLGSLECLLQDTNEATLNADTEIANLRATVKRQSSEIDRLKELLARHEGGTPSIDEWPPRRRNWPNGKRCVNPCHPDYPHDDLETCADEDAG